MTRRLAVRMTWLLGAVGVAIAVACKGSTAPHQPTPCPSYSGGLSQGDSLYGLYHLVSYCLDTLPAFTPPAESGHVTLTHAMGVDSFVRVSGFLVSVELPGRFMLQQNTLSVSGRLVVTGTSPHTVSFVGAR